jgi:hypothetical protein
LNSGEEEIRNNEDNNNRTVLGRAAMVKIQEHGRFLSIDILQQERRSFVNRLIVHRPSSIFLSLSRTRIARVVELISTVRSLFIPSRFFLFSPLLS